MKPIANYAATITNALKRVFRNPKVRLGAKAVIAGAAAYYANVKGAEVIDSATAQAALTAALWAALETLTPLNAAVGLFRQS